MKITVIASSEKYEEEHDYKGFFVVKIDGETKARFYDGEPEDANMGRDFSDVFTIPDLMRLAYDAGKRGDNFIVERIESDEHPY